MAHCPLTVWVSATKLPQGTSVGELRLRRAEHGGPRGTEEPSEDRPSPSEESLVSILGGVSGYIPPPPQTHTLKPECPGPQNVTACGGRVFKEVLKLKGGHPPGIASNLTGDLTKRKLRCWICVHTEKRTTCGPSEEVAVRKPRREASGETAPADTLILDVQPPEQEEIGFYSAGRPGCNGPSLWRPLQMNTAGSWKPEQKTAAVKSHTLARERELVGRREKQGVAFPHQ